MGLGVGRGLFESLMGDCQNTELNYFSAGLLAAKEKMMSYIFLAHLFATIFMTELIWMVQMVHYPLMDGVGEAFFLDYEARHTQTITWIVLPMMMLEIATGGLLLLFPTNIPLPALWIAFAMLLLIWLSTFALQVPLHNKLSQSFDATAHQQLVQTNWIRTFFWTLRSAILLWLTAKWMGV